MAVLLRWLNAGVRQASESYDSFKQYSHITGFIDKSAEHKDSWENRNQNKNVFSDSDSHFSVFLSILSSEFQFWSFSCHEGYQCISLGNNVWGHSDLVSLYEKFRKQKPTSQETLRIDAFFLSRCRQCRKALSKTIRKASVNGNVIINRFLALSIIGDVRLCSPRNLSTIHSI